MSKILIAWKAVVTGRIWQNGVSPAGGDPPGMPRFLSHGTGKCQSKQDFPLVFPAFVPPD
jgi:hypothetical protein